MTRAWVLLAGLVLFAPTVGAEIQQGGWWESPLPGIALEALGPLQPAAWPQEAIGFVEALHLIGGPEYVLPGGGLVLIEMPPAGLAAIQMPPGPLSDIATQTAQYIDAIRGMTGAGGQFDNPMAQVSTSVHEAFSTLLPPAGGGISMAQ
jgi:hypothetical protein